MPNYLTQHARERMTARNIPIGIIGLLLDYGEASSCRDGGISHAFTGSSLRAIKRDFGAGISKALAAHQNAFVVAVEGQVVTAAHARPGAPRRRRDRRAK